MTVVELNESQGNSTFMFEQVKDSNFAILKDHAENINKWGLDEMVARRFRFNGRFRPTELEPFLLDLFNDPLFRESFPVARAPVSGVNFERMRTETLSMDFFDRLLQESRIVSPAGSLRGCMEDRYDGMVCNDLLTDMFVNEDSEHQELFSSEERKEFIFHILRRLVLGGAMNQKEHDIQPYIEATKTLYRDLVTVHRNSSSGSVEVSSLVLRIRGLCSQQLDPATKSEDGSCNISSKIAGGGGSSVVEPYPQQGANPAWSDCFLIIDANKKNVTLWSFAYVDFW